MTKSPSGCCILQDYNFSISLFTTLHIEIQEMDRAAPNALICI